MYSKLDDKQKKWILGLCGKELYSKILGLWKEGKVDTETMRQSFAFWLNQHNIKGKWNKYERSELEEEALRVFI